MPKKREELSSYERRESSYNLLPNFRALSKVKCVHVSKISFSTQEKIVPVQSSTRGNQGRCLEVQEEEIVCDAQPFTS